MPNRQNNGSTSAALDAVSDKLDMLKSPQEQQNFDERMMRQALVEAERAFAIGDVPIGAVIVHNDRIIGRGCNQREQLQDPTAHAEMIALTAAASALNSWRLLDCTMYVTLEPCPMCAGGLVNARVNRLVYGADDPKAGACGTLYNIAADERLNHRVEIVRGILAEDCAQLLRAFFAQQRALGKK
jgi:tRNA(adenine34) deaminase